MFRTVWLLISILMGGAGLSLIAVEEPASPKTPSAIGLQKIPAALPYVLDYTLQKRIARGPVQRATEDDRVAFPVPTANNLFPEPFLMPVDRSELTYQFADWSAPILFLEPKSDGLLKYLEKRKTYKPDEWQKCVNWCIDQKLPLCAEWELRRQLTRFKHCTDPGCQNVMKQWLPLAQKHPTDYSFPLPVDGEWHVCADSTGHHRLKAGAAFAFDLVIQVNGRMFKNDGITLTDYYAWNQPLRAQADGFVVYADDRFDDLPIVRAHTGVEFDQANSIIIDYGGGTRVNYGHLQKGSLNVKSGDSVKPGQVVAKVGNSGASGAPHLHITMLDSQHLSRPGRFRYERKIGATWKKVDGEDLVEGFAIRNVDGAFQVKAEAAAPAEIKSLAPAATGVLQPAP